MTGPTDKTKDSSNSAEGEKLLSERRKKGEKLQIDQELAEAGGKLEDLLWSKLDEARDDGPVAKEMAIDNVLGVLELGEITEKEEAINATKLLKEGKIEEIIQTEWMRKRAENYSPEKNAKSASENLQKTENADSSQLELRERLTEFKGRLEKEKNKLEEQKWPKDKQGVVTKWQGLTEEQKSLRQWQEKVELQHLSAVNGKVKEILEALEIKEVTEALKNGGMREIKDEVDIEKIAKVIEETKNFIQESAKSRLNKLEEEREWLLREQRALAMGWVWPGSEQKLQELPEALWTCDKKIEETKNFIQENAKSRLKELEGKKEWLKEEKVLLEAGWEWLEGEEKLEAEQRLQELSEKLKACDVEIEKTKNYIKESAKSRLKELEERKEWLQKEEEVRLKTALQELSEEQETLETKQRLQELSEELNACDAEIEKTKEIIKGFSQEKNVESIGEKLLWEELEELEERKKRLEESKKQLEEGEKQLEALDRQLKEGEKRLLQERENRLEEGKQWMEKKLELEERLLQEEQGLIGLEGPKKLEAEQRLEKLYKEHNTCNAEIGKIIRGFNLKENTESIGKNLPEAEKNSVPKEPVIGQENSKVKAIYTTEQRVSSTELIKEFFKSGNEDKQNASEAPSKRPHLPENPSRENGVDFDGKASSPRSSNETEKNQKQNSSSGSPSLSKVKALAACLGMAKLPDKLAQVSSLLPQLGNRRPRSR